MNNTLTSIRILLAFTVVTGLAYPLAVTGAAKALWPAQAGGSLVQLNGKTIGSHLIAQETKTDRYFWARPSAASYNASNSTGSNYGPTSAALKKAADDHRTAMQKAHGPGAVPEDLIYASASGLDPHISPAAARYQVARVAAARKMDPAKLLVLVDAHVEGPQFGLFGEPRVNVLGLNLALDAQP
jgi:K+-transporting ATPase ATPase C chain